MMEPSTIKVVSKPNKVFIVDIEDKKSQQMKRDENASDSRRGLILLIVVGLPTLLNICLLFFTMSMSPTCLEKTVIVVDNVNIYTNATIKFRDIHALSDEFIHEINKKAVTWKAGQNFGKSVDMDYIRRLMGVKRDSLMVTSKIPHTRYAPDGKSGIPVNFDSREKWSHCKSISEIRDQGSCGSCWAFGSAETMTDRHCIHNNETFHYSAEDLLSCCKGCGVGCDGGYPLIAFNFWLNEGLVSGGPYDSTEGCSPYQVPACEHHESEGDLQPCGDVLPTPICTNKCQPTYDISYHDDKHYAKYVTHLIREEDIIKELYKNGPIEACFDVYEDFLHYKSGVYHHVSGGLVGSHSIKVIGYGVEEGLDYYLCSNSWNSDWGNEGYFKIVRDEVHQLMITGVPLPRNV